ncbi:MAG: prepilin-type N-terminal cleavage/methylation domain-containing protein [Candidatus Riflebacteria bacterium]|nr:prepilin-type N-terminal cleavage/methylation domain-containing protein [Candidatus Riflebacteria bacterium]
MSYQDRRFHSYLVRAPASGYTLVELLVVVALCAVVLTMAIYLFAQSGLTSRRLAKTQNLQDVTNRLLLDLRRDMRSATEASFSSEGMRLLVTQLSQEGVPEQVEVLYHFSGEGVTREEDSRSKRFTFKTLIESDDHWSITTLHKRHSDAGVFVQIDAHEHSGNVLLQVVEKLISVDPASSVK